MKKMLNKFAALALAVCMICSFGVLSASAAAPYSDGDYTTPIIILSEGKDEPSMSSPLFCSTADITVQGDSTAIRLYVANPVPAFPDQGADGTLKNVKMTLGGVQYDFVSDMETKPLRKYSADGSIFGIEAGEEYPSQILTATIPTDQLDALQAAPVSMSAFVNVVMSKDQTFRLRVDPIRKDGAPSVQPSETRTDTMQITAAIEAPKPTYDVVIPEVIAMGTLSKEAPNTFPYQVEVTAENLGSGKVVVSSDPKVLLKKDGCIMVCSNSFGTQETSVTATLSGTFSIRPQDVAASEAGNYVGTASFAISYYAGK